MNGVSSGRARLREFQEEKRYQKKAPDSSPKDCQCGKCRVCTKIRQFEDGRDFWSDKPLEGFNEISWLAIATGQQQEPTPANDQSDRRRLMFELIDQFPAVESLFLNMKSEGE